LIKKHTEVDVRVHLPDSYYVPIIAKHPLKASKKLETHWHIMKEDGAKKGEMGT
jgi:DNA anti-recombination protein RmuC